MKIHETIHTGEKAFCCVYRDETFKNYYSLRTMEEAIQEKTPHSYQQYKNTSNDPHCWKSLCLRVLWQDFQELLLGSVRAGGPLHPTKNNTSNLGIGKEDVGLYRDDGLSILRRSKRELDTIRKKLHTLINPLGLQITAETGMKSVDFLDVTLHLESGNYEPYRKEDEPPKYINKKSNHPITITKNIPVMIEKRLNNRCSNKAMFDKHKQLYQSAIESSGYRANIT